MYPSYKSFSLILGAVPRYGSFYGRSSGPIFLTDLFCSGTESSLMDCNRNVYDITSCYHFEDAGVECQGLRKPTFKSFEAAS